MMQNKTYCLFTSLQGSTITPPHNSVKPKVLQHGVIWLNDPQAPHEFYYVSSKKSINDKCKTTPVSKQSPLITIILCFLIYKRMRFTQTNNSLGNMSQYTE